MVLNRDKKSHINGVVVMDAEFTDVKNFLDEKLQLMNKSFFLLCVCVCEKVQRVQKSLVFMDEAIVSI